MNKSMVIGLIGGIGIATAGGVGSYALLSQSGDQEQGATAVVEKPSAVETSPAVDTTLAGQSAQPTPVPTPAPTSRPRTTAPAPAPAPAPTATQAAAPQVQPAVSAPVAEQRCWDEEVTVQADPRDDKAVAGTAAGAVLGGAIAKRLGDDNDLATAAGAAAGALAGRRLQRRVQENNTTTVMERRCEPVP